MKGTEGVKESSRGVNERDRGGGEVNERGRGGVMTCKSKPKAVR